MKNFISVIALISLNISLHAQLAPGDLAPAFTLKNVDGEMISLSDYSQNKGAIVVFTCNGCPVAKAYLDRIIDLNRRFANQGFPVIAINPNDPELAPVDSYENMQKLASEKELEYPYLFDEAQSVYPAYGATRTPHTFLLANSDDGFKVAYIGAIDDNQRENQVEEKFLEDAIAALLKGETPRTTETRAVGCGIKSKGQKPQ
jgi:peroxiredoxin